MIDLHTHTTASDGSLAPRELIRMASRVPLSAIAVTDHDTLSGIAQALDEGDASGVRVIPGVELSAQSPAGTMHILGLFLDPNSKKLSEKLEGLRKGRSLRNPVIIKKLEELGMTISLNQVLKVAGGESVGRPHIAQIMVEAGYVDNVDEAFDKYLGRGKPAYSGRDRFSPEDSIEIIHNAGGAAVLAHPATLTPNPEMIKKIVTVLKSYGLDGIEVYSTFMRGHNFGNFNELAKELDLAMSGGTDYHGAAKPSIKLGTGAGDFTVPDSFLPAIEDRANIYSTKRPLSGAASTI